MIIDHHIKFHEDRSFHWGDICKTILVFFNRWFSMYFSYFLNYAPPKPSEMDNYWMVMAFFGNHISKCNRLSRNIRPIQAIEVLYRLRNKQKHYIIYSETPCSTIITIKDVSNKTFHFLSEHIVGQFVNQALNPKTSFTKVVQFGMLFVKIT